MPQRKYRITPNGPRTIQRKKVTPPAPPAPAPQVDIGMLAGRAFLTKLTWHFWNAIVAADDITSEVNTKYNTEGGYTKRLLGKYLKPLRSKCAAVVAVHKFYTLPWTNDSWRIVASGVFLDYDTKLRKAIDEVKAELEKFLLGYDDMVEDKKKNDKSFKAENYLTKEQIRKRIGFDRFYKPIPSGGDIRVSLSDDALAAVRSSVDNEQQERIKTAVFDIAKRLKDTVGHMVERLRAYKPPDVKNKKKAENTFHDSLVDNVNELVELLPKINVTADPRIDLIVTDLKALLVGVTADHLRDDDKKRKEVAQAAEKILERVGDFV